MTVTTEEQRLNGIIRRIRSLEQESVLTILRNNKKTDWKNQLLNSLSDTVVLNHIKNLHPFQISRISCNENLIELHVPYYLYQVYIKIDFRTNEVLSFHLSENNYTGEIYKYWDATKNKSDTDLLQVIPADGSRDAFCILAIGNNTIKCFIVKSDYSTGLFYTDISEYSKALKMAAGAPLRLLQNSFENIDWGLIPNKDFIGDYNLLSVAENSDQLISLMFDLYENNKELTWVKDTIIAELSLYPDSKIKKFEEKLHKSIRPIPSLRTLPDTFLEDYSLTLTNEFGK